MIIESLKKLHGIDAMLENNKLIFMKNMRKDMLTL